MAWLPQRDVPSSAFLIARSTSLSEKPERRPALTASSRLKPVSPAFGKAYDDAKRARETSLAQVVELEEYRRLTHSLRRHVAQALIKPGSRRWLMITSPANFDICLRLSRWGDERWPRIAQVQRGDGIAFYVTGEHTLGAIAVAVGSARPSVERPWPDRAYPYQMDIEFLAVAAPRPSIRPLISDLELFRGSKRNWGRQLQATLRPISEHDYALLAEAVGVTAEADQIPR
jgi:hypothetical protein